MALGTSDASLVVRNCNFIANEGSSAIVINNGVSMTSSGGGESTSGATAAMSVEVINCTFARNELSLVPSPTLAGRFRSTTVTSWRIQAMVATSS